MSIAYTQPRQHKTGTQSVVINDQSAYTVSFKFRVDAIVSTGVNCYVVGRGANVGLAVYYTPTSSTAATLNIFVRNAANTLASLATTVTLGTLYHVVITYDQGAQKVYLNTSPTTIGTLTGNSPNSTTAWQIGGTTGDGQTTIDDVIAISGYAATQADVTALYLGTHDADDIGAHGTWYGWWSLDGTNGATPTNGDAGLACQESGSNSLNLTTVAGTGSSVYASSLTPTADAEIQRAYVCTSGRAVGIVPQAVSTEALATVTGTMGVPTLKKNGASVGSLRDPWVTGHHQCILYRFPDGVQAAAGDVFSISADDGWLMTNVGIVAAVTDFPLENCYQKSAVGTDATPKTLRFGLNNPWSSPSIYNRPGRVVRNLATGIGPWASVSTEGPDGYPIALSADKATADFIFSGSTNGIDSLGFPGATGYYAVGWTGTTSSFKITALSNATVNEVTGLANPGSGGVGRVKVFDVQYSPSASSSNLVCKLELTDTSRSPDFSDLVIYGPGDFSYTPGNPVDLSGIDPVSLSTIYAARTANGVGSLRFMDSLLGSGGASSVAEPEQLHELDDTVWARALKDSRHIGLVSAIPWNPATHPYIYTSQSWGQTYTATLSVAISTTPAAGTQEVITISDAQAAPTDATGPVIAGLKLTIGSEIMRVLSVSGTSVTVERGSEGTTPATHSTGSITVSGRRSIDVTTWGTYRVAHLFFDAPHRLQSGQAPITAGTTWPALSWVDGGTGAYLNYRIPCYVTGHDNYLYVPGNGSTTSNTLTTTYTLTPSTCYMNLSLPQGGFSHEFTAMVADQFDDCHLHVNIGVVMSNTCVDVIARRIRDNISADREVWIEYTNEPWNSLMGPHFPYLYRVNRILYPEGFGYEWVLLRTWEIRDRFVAIFDELGRGSQIKCLLNTQMTAASIAESALAFARAQSKTLDAIACAPYTHNDDSAPTISWINAADDEQVVDEWIHNLWYNVSTSGTITARVRGALEGFTAKIAAHNALISGSTVLYGYEGGLEQALPDAVTNAVTRESDIFYNPNFRQAELDTYCLFQQYFHAFNVYALQHCTVPASDWSFYYSPEQLPGKGDGSDGLADNRLTLACPGKTHSKDAATNIHATNVSVRGQAYLDWMGDIGGAVELGIPSQFLLLGFGGTWMTTFAMRSGEAPVYGLSVLPSRVLPSTTVTVEFIGVGTSWLSSTPTFTPTGDPVGDGGWSLGSLTVVDDTHAHRSLTVGATRGEVTWTDSTTGQTGTMMIGPRNQTKGGVVALFSRRRGR